MIRRFLTNYLPRHSNRVNQVFHAVGVPLTFIGTPWTWLSGAPWYVPLACFVVGYALQFVGHAIEGNDAGETVFVKRLLGLSYTEYAPGIASSSAGKDAVDTKAD